MDEQQQLRETLEKLRAELEKHQPVDPESRDLLRRLQKDIQNTLEGSGEEQAAHYHSLRGRLTTALDRLENSHPQLTLAIGRVLDNLAAIGL